MILSFSSVRHQNNAFDDTVFTFKSQIKVLKEPIFVKRVQNDAYNKHKAELSDGDLLVYMLISLRAIEMISKMKTKAPTLEIKTFCSLRRAVILKMQKRDKE